MKRILIDKPGLSECFDGQKRINWDAIERKRASDAGDARAEDWDEDATQYLLRVLRGEKPLNRAERNLAVAIIKDWARDLRRNDPSL